MNSLLLICSFQALFLSSLVFMKKKRAQSDKILAFWLLIIAIHIFLEFLQRYNFHQDFPYPWLIGLDVSFTVLHASLIYLYILSYSRIGRKNAVFFIHLMPFFAINLLLYIFYYSKSADEKIQDYNSVMNGTGFTIKPLVALTYLIMTLVLLYLAASLMLIRKHKKNLHNHFSTTGGMDLKWLQVLLYSLGAVMLVAILLEILSNTFFLVPADASSVIVFIFVAIGIFYIGMQGILTTDNFSTYKPGSPSPSPGIESKSTKGKQNDPSPGLEEETMNRKYQELLELMRTEKPYLEPSLSLPMLAEKLVTKAHLLSKIINTKAACNFFDFVNSYRIEEFKSELQNPDNKNYTLISIAYGCGFNSKTAFNRVFKNHTGITPSEYFNSIN